MGEPKMRTKKIRGKFGAVRGGRKIKRRSLRSNRGMSANCYWR